MQSENQFVTFVVDKEVFGINIADVQEIIKWQNITKQPDMKQEMLGITKLRNQIIPLISLRRYFGLPDFETLKDTKNIIVEKNQFLYGLNVDSVESVVSLPDSVIEPPISFAGSNNEFIKGIAKNDERLIILLDIDSLVSFGEEELLQASIAAD